MLCACCGSQRGQPRVALELAVPGAARHATDGTTCIVSTRASGGTGSTALARYCWTAHARSRIPADRIEIELPDGSRVRVGAAVSLTALRRVVAALRR